MLTFVFYIASIFGNIYFIKSCRIYYFSRLSTVTENVKKMQYYFCYHLCRSISKSSNYILLHYLNSLSNAPTTRYKKLQGRNPEIISLVFWKKFSDQKDILKLTDLYKVTSKKPERFFSTLFWLFHNNWTSIA